MDSFTILLFRACFLLIFTFARPCFALDPSIIEELKLPPVGKEAQPSEVKPSEVVHWTTRESLRYPDGSVLVSLTLKTDRSFSIYASHLQFTSRSGLDLKKMLTPDAQEIEDPITGKRVQVFSGGDFTLHFQGMGEFEKTQFPLSIRYIACSGRICLFPYTEEIEIPNYKSPEAFPDLSKKTSPVLESAHIVHPKNFGEDETFEEQLVERMQMGNVSLLMILLALFLGGLLTNLTPCVYPMIPITIRLLSQQTKRPYLAATAYAGGIVLIYSVLGLSVAYTGTLFGQYMANSYVNLALAATMFLLGFSMLGFGHWSALTRFGHKIGIDKPSLIQAFLMGCGAGLVASPCTGPILATILTYIIAHKDLARSTLYIFTYSVGFGLPYIVLGGLSGKIAHTKVSHKVQIFVKIIFAAVMFALSCYYLRIPLYEEFMEWTMYWQPLCILSLLLGLLSWRLIVLVQHHRKQSWLMLLPAVLLGVSLFSGSRWMTEAPVESAGRRIPWMYNEEVASEFAKQQNVPLLIDFWAEWCAACKKMDATTFSDSKFIEELERRNVVYLKIDVTQDTVENTKLLEKYKVQGLPTVVIGKPGSEQPLLVSGYASAARLLNYFNE